MLPMFQEVDPNGDTLIYNVLSDNVGGMLEIIGSKLQFKDNFTADYEILQDLQFTLRATDTEGLTLIKVLNFLYTTDLLMNINLNYLRTIIGYMKIFMEAYCKY